MYVYFVKTPLYSSDFGDAKECSQACFSTIFVYLSHLYVILANPMQINFDPEAIIRHTLNVDQCG